MHPAPGRQSWSRAAARRAGHPADRPGQGRAEPCRAHGAGSRNDLRAMTRYCPLRGYGGCLDQQLQRCCGPVQDDAVADDPQPGDPWRSRKPRSLGYGSPFSTRTMPPVAGSGRRSRAQRAAKRAAQDMLTPANRGLDPVADVKPDYAAKTTRPWPSVAVREKPTVRTDRPGGIHAVRHTSVGTATQRLTAARDDTPRVAVKVSPTQVVGVSTEGRVIVVHVQDRVDQVASSQSRRLQLLLRVERRSSRSGADRTSLT